MQENDDGAAARDELASLGHDWVRGKSANFWLVGGAVLHCWKGEEMQFKEILNDKWTAGFHYQSVVLIYAGNDLGRIKDSHFAWFVSELVEWAEYYKVELRLVDVVGRSYL